MPRLRQFVISLACKAPPYHQGQQRIESNHSQVFTLVLVYASQDSCRIGITNKQMTRYFLSVLQVHKSTMIIIQSYVSFGPHTSVYPCCDLCMFQSQAWQSPSYQWQCIISSAARIRLCDGRDSVAAATGLSV